MSMLKPFTLIVLCWLPLALMADGPQRLVAFAQDTMGNDFRQAQVFEVRDELATHPNMQFAYSDAKGKTSLLIWHIEQFIKQPVDVLIVGTNDASAVVPVVSKARRQGVPVIILDRGIEGGDYTSFINSDNLKIGSLGADYIARRLHGKGTVLLFEGLEKADVTQLRSAGFLSEIGKYPDIRVIRRTGNYLRKDAIVEMEKLVRDEVPIDAIFSESDSMLSGVRLVWEKYRIDPRGIITVGCDYTGEAREAIRNGTQSGSVLFPLGGRQAAQIALRIMAGEAVPKHLSIPVQLVTQDNVEEIEPIF